MAYNDDTHEFEATIQHVTAKSRLIEIVDTGERYFLPKKCTVDFNISHYENNYYLFVVSDWWWKKRTEFEVKDE